MTDVGFYQLRSTPLESAVARLLERALSGGHRALVLAGSEERLEQLNSRLWSFSPTSFVPHGTRREGRAADQPVWLTLDEANSNGADLLVLTDGREWARLGDFRRCVDIFDGRVEDALMGARRRWKAYRSAGHAVTYWEQNEKGGWDNKASG